MKSASKRNLEAARGYISLELPRLAQKELARIEDISQCAFDYHYLQGEAYRLRKEHEKALSHFSMAHDVSPTDLGSLLGMAWCLKRLDQLDRAIEMTAQAYKAHPQEPIILYNLACYHALAGHKSDALSWLGRALRMESSLRSLIDDEMDFDPLRNDPDFQYLTSCSQDQIDTAE
ncbi:MAG: tetratricopeptide repeat protein [Planctomycetota bacterium]|nr:tetratricopeptide repeat protein [Planctomycetota bacterium]MDA1211579.1 tetratricopeptide repeat protein [Planctomycetota bacterium]